MTNFSLKTIEEIKRKWMVGYNEEMICKQLKMTKKVYREYDRWIHDLLHSKLFKLAKDGYITTLIDSMEQRAKMADLLKEKIDVINEKINIKSNNLKLISYLSSAITTWNNLMDSRDSLLNDTPMMQSFHNFIQYNIEKGHAPEMPTDENVQRVSLAALPEMVPKKKHKK